jgi:tetratricopeptide (TPR) repeat protein
LLIAPIFAWGVWTLYKNGQKAAVFGLAVFFFNVVFMLQIFGAGQGFIADRFTYIPYLGLFFIVGYALNQLLETQHKNAKVFLGIAAGYILISGIATYQQNKIWENGSTLWSHVMEKYPNSATPYINKGKYWIEIDTREGYQEAFTNYSAGIELTEKAESVVDVRSKLGELYVNRGVARVKLNYPQEALQDMNKGLELNPDNVEGYKNRYIVHDQMGNYSKALEDIQTYLRNEPNNAQMWYESARTKRLMDLPQESIPDYSQAIYLDGNNPYYYYERSKAYATIGDVEKAKADLTICLQMGYTQVDPGYRKFLGL